MISPKSGGRVSNRRKSNGNRRTRKKMNYKKKIQRKTISHNKTKTRKGKKQFKL